MPRLHRSAVPFLSHLMLKWFGLRLRFTLCCFSKVRVKSKSTFWWKFRNSPWKTCFPLVVDKTRSERATYLDAWVKLDVVQRKGTSHHGEQLRPQKRRHCNACTTWRAPWMKPTSDFFPPSFSFRDTKNSTLGVKIIFQHSMSPLWCDRHTGLKGQVSDYGVAKNKENGKRWARDGKDMKLTSLPSRVRAPKIPFFPSAPRWYKTCLFFKNKETRKHCFESNVLKLSHPCWTLTHKTPFRHFFASTLIFFPSRHNVLRGLHLPIEIREK